MAVKNGDFIEIEYSGSLEDGSSFDRSEAPIIICLGEQHILPGLEKKLVGLEVGREYEISISPEEGFGVRNAKLIRLIPISRFLKENIEPVPGLEVSIDGILGVVKAVTGGRVLVDMNHPLAGKKLNYKIKIIREVKDEKEKAEAILKMRVGEEKFQILTEKELLTIQTERKLPEEVEEKVSEEIKRHTNFKQVNFQTKSESENKKESKAQAGKI
ncbi:MAG: peptidylprolyl isomerase [Candidatus Woesearchaeota archaeon]